MSQIGVKDKGLKSSSLSHDEGVFGPRFYDRYYLSHPTPQFDFEKGRNIPLVPTEAAVRMEIVN